MLPHWLQLQQQQVLPWSGQRHCCDNPQVAFCAPPVLVFALRCRCAIPVFVSDACQLPPCLALLQSLLNQQHVSGLMFLLMPPWVCVLSPLSSVSFHPCPLCPTLSWSFPGVSSWLCVEPGLLWGGCFRMEWAVLADAVSRGGVGVCAPPVSPSCA